MSARIFLLLLLVLAGLLTTVVARTTGPSTVTDGATPDTTSFGEGFLEHLTTVQVAAEALVDLGERRERNLLVVGQRQAAMNDALNATDAWLAQRSSHEDDPAVAAYRTSARVIRQAMADAQSAFLRFDWDGIAAANVTLNEGVQEIEAAVAELAAGEAG